MSAVDVYTTVTNHPSPTRTDVPEFRVRFPRPLEDGAWELFALLPISTSQNVCVLNP